MARALASVSQSARHRIEFFRRVRSQATEGRASLVGMLGITYLLTLLLWRAYPQRFEGFFEAEVGIALTTTVLILQGIGLVWTTLLTRINP
jgi:Flp pilus assembly protein TadB